MNTADSFSADYDEARRKFRDAALAADARLHMFEHPERGPDNGRLFTDVAQFGPQNANKVLVLISGTHGVEGFCGSGAQVDFLRRGENRDLPQDTGLLMIHAINPYGFAWLRRVTHENIDLNRNWIDFNEALPVNEGHRALFPALCPEQWSEEVRETTDAEIRAYMARKGEAATRQAMSGGQYEFPGGLYYGGTAPSWSRMTQTRIFEDCLSSAAAVAIVDYHTGLGPWGFGEHIISEPVGSAAFERAGRWYGGTVKSMVDGSSSSPRLAGDGLSAAPQLLPAAEVTGIALEIGTLPRERVVPALRADCWLHTHGDPRSPEAIPIKAAIRDAYYGDRDDWKGMVAGQSLLACRQALAGLRSMAA